MNEERERTNNLPELAEGVPIPRTPKFLKSRNWIDTDIGSDFLNFEDPYRPPRYTMERNGVPFANVGELHVISGKPGHGKTGLMSQLMAVVLCGKFGNTTGRETARKQLDPDNPDELLKDANGREIEKPVPTKVLYIDTEQGKDDTIAIKNRVCTLAGINYTKPCDKFYILRLRDTESPEERWQKVLKAVYVLHPTDIFLDGMLDIVRDYNDQVECQPIIREAMMLATHYDSSLWMVLHENPLVDKLVGTLGSITQRKVAEIFTVVKVKQSEQKEADRRADLPDIYFKVKQVKARGKDVDDWLFRYETTAGGWGQPVEIEDITQKNINPSDKVRQESISRFKDMSWTPAGVTYNDLDRHLTKQGIISGATKSNIINAALDSQVIYSQGTKGHRKFFYNGEKIINDEQNSIPFTEEEDCPF